MTNANFNELIEISEERLGKDRVTYLIVTPYDKHMAGPIKSAPKSGLQETLEWVDKPSHPQNPTLELSAQDMKLLVSRWLRIQRLCPDPAVC